MLTPVDVQNKVFKGGIGFDKKDVEAFMKELSSDYEQLYRSNVELNDKVATLTESLQHYRATEDSMQKALTLSQKTAEETINAANDKARQISNEAAKKAENLLADAKQELIETKDEIFRLQKLHAKFKEQYRKILEGQLQLIEKEVVDIDLGEGYEMESFHESRFGYNEGGLGGGLGSLGDGGGYTGASSFDDRFERTNQDPAFNRGTLNTDPFADAANGGGRFSRQTGKGFTGSSSNAKKQSGTENRSSLNMKSANTASTRIKRNPVANAAPRTNVDTNQQNIAATNTGTKGNTDSVQTQTVSEHTAPKRTVAEQAAPEYTEPKQTSPLEHLASDYATKKQENPSASETQSVPFHQTADLKKDEAIVTGDVEAKLDESSMIGNEDDYSEGFRFMEEDSASDSGTVQGEVEDRIDESTLIGNEDNDDEGFQFMEDASEDDGIISGEVEDKIDESSLIGNDDDDEEGFSFMEEETSDDIVSGEVEAPVNESNMLDSEDNYTEGFQFFSDSDEFAQTDSDTKDVENYTQTASFANETEDYAQTASFANETEDYAQTAASTNETAGFDQAEEEEAYSGEVEDKVNEATMLESEDDYNEGFHFVVGDESEEEIPTISSGPSLNINLDAFTRKEEPEEDVFVGDVEDLAKQSNLIGNADDDDEGFDFL